MDEAVQQSLSQDALIDITTVGRKTGRPRRLEIWFHYQDSRIFITGTPGQLYIIPVLFAFTPLIGGEPIEALRVFLLGSLGIYGLSAAFAGHGEAPLRAPARLLYGGAGIALLWPEPLALNLAGAAVALVLIAYDWRRSRPQKDVL